MGMSFVIPIVVYHGQRTWSAKPLWERFPGLPESFRRFLPEMEYILTDLGKVPDDIIKAKEELGALRSVYLTFKYAFDEIKLERNFRDILIFVSSSGNAFLDTLLAEMVFTYVQKRLQMAPKDLENMIDALPDESKSVVMSTYDKVIAKGRMEGRMEGIELKNREFVTNLLRSTDWDDAKIAALAGVEETYVRDLRRQIQSTAK